MNSYPFRLLDDDSLVVVDGFVDGMKVRLAIDTGASHTVLNLLMLYMNDYTRANIDGTVKFETAQGVMEAYLLQVRKLEVLGITQKNFTVSSYDFIAHGLLPEFDGMLGLDFFKGKKVCFDFGKNVVSIEDSPPANA